MLILESLDGGIVDARLGERRVDPEPDRRALHELVEQIRSTAQDAEDRGPSTDVVDAALEHRIHPTLAQCDLRFSVVVESDDRDLQTRLIGEGRDVVGDRGLTHVPELEGLGTSRVGPEQDEDGEDGERDHRGDHEPLVAEPHPEVPGGDNPPHPAIRHRSLVAHADSTSRKSSASVGRTRLKCLTSPTERARSSTR